MKPLTTSQLLWSLLGSMFGVIMMGLVFITVSSVLASPTANPPEGNPAFPTQGPEGPRGPAGANGAQGPAGPAGIGNMAIIAQHSQSTTTPGCPTGWNKLWDGYSYMGSDADPGYGIGQDLGGSGSCLRRLASTSPFVECWGLNCNINTGWDHTAWLSIGQTVDEGPVSGISTCAARISRCSVCEKATTVVVEHSETTAIPSCPAGYSSLWTGYSFLGAFLTRHHKMMQDLASPGSCLKKQRAVPFIEARGTDQCDFNTGGDMSLWLQAGTGFQYSRCNVCAKD